MGTDYKPLYPFYRDYSADVSPIGEYPEFIGGQ